MGLLPVVASFLVLLFFSGCASKVTYAHVSPAPVHEAAMVKTVTVLPFYNDTNGLGNRIESRLSQTWTGGKPFYTLVVAPDAREAARLGADAVISGEVNGAYALDDRFTEERQHCVKHHKEDKECKEWRTVRIPCLRRTLFYSATVRISDARTGRLFYTMPVDKQLSGEKCRDESDGLPDVITGLTAMAEEAAGEFCDMITPHTVYRTVELLDEPDVPLNDAAVEAGDDGRFQAARNLLASLSEGAGAASVAVWYDLGAMEEALGDPHKALAAYGRANQLAGGGDALVSSGVERVRNRINDDHRLEMQTGKSR